MQPTRKLSADEQFFFDHGSYSWTPPGETQEAGRTRCAIEAAAAEALYMQAHRLADIGMQWEADPDDSADGDSTPSTREQAYIWQRHENGTCEPLAYLGSIADADANYRRVIRAELAAECADALREIIAGK